MNNLSTGADGEPLPYDYVRFCEVLSATGCLYLPGGATLGCDGVVCLDNDPYASQSWCNGYGGVYGETAVNGPGCAFFYPLQFSMKFNPGQPTGLGLPHVRQSTNCPSPQGVVSLTSIVDPLLGTVQLTATTSSNSLALQSYVGCAVSVFVKK